MRNPVERRRAAHRRCAEEAGRDRLGRDRPEMGSVWRRLGADVTVLEGLPTFLGAVDEQIAKEAKKSFDKQGLKIELGVKIGEIKTGKKGKESKVSVAYTNAKGEAVALDVDKLIVSIGRVHHRPERRAGPAAGRSWRNRGGRRSKSTCPGFGPGRCGARPTPWRTRPRRAWLWPNAWPASTDVNSTPFPGSSTPARDRLGRLRANSWVDGVRTGRYLPVPATGVRALR